MSTFAEVGLSPELTRALEERGIVEPTPFQEQAIPVVRRGHNLVARVGPGAGLLVGVVAPLVERLEDRKAELRALFLTPTAERAESLARSAAPLAAESERSVAALGPGWADPDRADLLFATPEAALSGVRRSRLKLEGLEAFVLEGGAALDQLGTFDAAETLAELVSGEAQRVVLSLPVTDTVEEFASRHLRKAVHLPPRRVSEEDDSHIPHRGELRFHGLDGGRGETLLHLVPALRRKPGERLLLFFHTAVEATVVEERLTLHGFRTGAPGDRDAPIWLAVDERDARQARDALQESRSVTTVSYRVPVGPDSLDRRHGSSREAHVLIRGRELPHLREVAREAGYTLSAAPTPIPDSRRDALDRFRERIRRVLDEEDLTAELLLLEPLLQTRGGAEVAAAAVRLLRERRSAAPDETPPRPAPSEKAEERPPAWVRLFVSLGHKDHAGPGDILGAITGEAEIDGDQVGRIDIRDTFTLVEVTPRVAERVIEAVNGITVKGRSVRVDYHRRRGGDRSGRGRGESRKRS